jgi:signal peptidase I
VALVAASVAGCAATAPSPSGPAGSAATPTCVDPVSGGARIFEVKGPAMEPGLEPGERILVVPGGEPRRLDVVVFYYPEGFAGPKEPAVKRVIGLPGETVEIEDGAVRVDGTVPTYAPGDPARWVVGDDELFVLGDHREMSADSRTFGLIPMTEVLGVVGERCR